MSVIRFLKTSIWFFALAAVFGTDIKLKESIPTLLEISAPKKGFGIAKLESIGLGDHYSCHLGGSTISCCETSASVEGVKVISGTLEKQQIKLQFKNKWYMVHVQSGKLKYLGWHDAKTPLSTHKIMNGDYMVMIADLPVEKKRNLEERLQRGIDRLSDLQGFLNPKAILKAVSLKFGDCSTELKLFKQLSFPRIMFKPDHCTISTDAWLPQKEKVYHIAYPLSSGNFQLAAKTAYSIWDHGQYSLDTKVIGTPKYVGYKQHLFLSHDKINFKWNEDTLEVEISEGQIYLKKRSSGLLPGVLVYRDGNYSFTVNVEKKHLEEGDSIVVMDLGRDRQDCLEKMIPNDMKLDDLTRWVDVAAAFVSHRLLVLQYGTKETSTTLKSNHSPVSESSLLTDDVKETTVFPKTVMSSTIKREGSALSLPLVSSNGIESELMGDSHQRRMILGTPLNLENIDSLENLMGNLEIDKVNKHFKTLPKESNTNLVGVIGEIPAAENDSKKDVLPIFGSINNSDQRSKERNCKRKSEWKEIPGWGVSHTIPNKRPSGLSLSWWNEGKDVEINAFSSDALIIFESTSFAFHRYSGDNCISIRIEGNILRYNKKGRSPLRLAIVRGQKEMKITLNDFEFKIKEGDVIIIRPTKLDTKQAFKPANTYEAFYETLKVSLERGVFDTPFVAKVLNFN